MLKSRSLSSGVTKPCTSNKSFAPFLKFSAKKFAIQLKNPFKNQYPLKFPKKLVHKRTQMHMLSVTQESQKRLCTQASPNWNKSSIFQSPSPQGRGKNPGQFHNLSYQSPNKSMRLRQFEDIGNSCRKKLQPDHNNSINVMACIPEGRQNIKIPSKEFKNSQKKYLTKPSNMQQHLGWNEQANKNKERYHLKYKGKPLNKNRYETTQQASYAAIHLKHFAK